MACKDFNVPEGINTDEEWAEIHPWLRPVLLSIVKSKKVLLEGVTFKNSPSWCLHPLSCEDFTVNNIMVINPWYSQNGDAIDLESCKNALIINSVFDAGDDAICIKSGKDEDGRRRGEPCQNVIVKNNTVLHGHGGFVVGSEMSGGVKNIYVEDCTFMGTDVGLRFKSTRGRGGVVENIYINNINMINIPNAIVRFVLRRKRCRRRIGRRFAESYEDCHSSGNGRNSGIPQYSYFKYCLQRFGACDVLQRSSGNANQQCDG